MIKRIILDILFLISLIVFPFWVNLIFVLLLIFYFDNYYEAIVAGFALDFIYSIPTEMFSGFRFVSALIFTIIFFISGPLKKRLRYYHR